MAQTVSDNAHREADTLGQSEKTGLQGETRLCFGTRPHQKRRNEEAEAQSGKKAQTDGC